MFHVKHHDCLGNRDFLRLHCYNGDILKNKGENNMINLTIKGKKYEGKLDFKSMFELEKLYARREDDLTTAYNSIMTQINYLEHLVTILGVCVREGKTSVGESIIIEALEEVENPLELLEDVWLEMETSGFFALTINKLMKEINRQVSELNKKKKKLTSEELDTLEQLENLLKERKEFLDRKMN